MAEEQGEKPKAEEIELTIIRTDIDAFIEPGVTRKQRYITFYNIEAGIPPETVVMWADEWTLEKEAEMIAKKIQEIKSRKTEKARVKITY